MPSGPLLSLAAHDGIGWLSVARISAAMDIPERFLPRVMTDLVRSGLVEGHLGRTGGYRLARPAASISLLEVIQAVEPDDGSGRACSAAGPVAGTAPARSTASSRRAPPCSTGSDGTPGRPEPSNSAAEATAYLARPRSWSKPATSGSVPAGRPTPCVAYT